MTLVQSDVDGPRSRGKFRKEPMMAEEAVQKLEIAFAEFKGAVSADLKNLSHDVKNLTMAMGQVMPRTEHEKEQAAVKERMDKLESSNVWFTRQAIAQWIGGLTIGGTIFKKLL